MMKKGLALLLTLCLLLIPGCSSKKENVIKIVDGRVTEQKLVHRMIKMLVEDRTDLTVSIGEEMTAVCLLYTSPSPRDRQKSRMPSSA